MTAEEAARDWLTASGVTYDKHDVRSLTALILARERAARVEAWMPIHSTPFAIRMSALSEEWAQRNHGQSLGQLAERGGLDLAEAASIVESRPYYPRTAREAIHAINDWLAARAEEEGRR